MKVPADGVERLDCTVTLQRPLPASAVYTDHLLRRFVDRKSRRHGFKYSLNYAPHPETGEPNAMLHSIKLIGAPKFSIEEIYTAARWAEKLSGDAASRAVELNIDSSWMDKVSITSCLGCPHYRPREGGLPGNCVSISWLWEFKGQNRDAEYVMRYRLHRKPEETHRMELGTDAHEMLFIARQPVTTVEELVERLVGGERVAWAIPICTPQHGLRARTPDIVVSKMVKADDCYLLVHYAIEDKPHAIPTYWLQAWACAAILTDRNVQVHKEMPDDTHIVNVQKIPFMDAIRLRGGIDDITPIHVRVYCGLNAYGKDEKNPKDNFDWVLRGDGIGRVNESDLWSIDNRPLDRSPRPGLGAPKELMYAVLGARKKRAEAFLRGIIDKSKTSQMQFTTSTREDLDGKVELADGVSMFRPKARR